MIQIGANIYTISPPISESYESVGEIFRTFSNTLASQVRSQKRRWQCETSFLTNAQKIALRSATDLDAQVSVTGTMAGVTVTFNAVVTVTLTLQLLDLWIAQLDIREV